MKLPLLALLLAAHLSAHAVTPDEAIAALNRSLDAPLIKPGEPAPPGLAARMARIPVPGLSIAVLHQGRLHWAQGFGEAQAGVPVTPDTRFQAGSISKPVAALGALALAQQQGVGFDDDLRPLLKGWQPPPDDSSPPRYTLRRLLSHSAGLGQGGFPGYAVGAPLPTLAQVLDGVPPANTGPVRPVQPAGGGWRYSGGGSTLVQLWVESQSGEPFADAMQRLVLQPLGMGHSHYQQPPVDTRYPYAHAHQGRTAEPGGWRVYPERQAAGLWTTPSDLARLLMAVQQGRAGTGPLTPEVVRAATTVVIAPSTAGFFSEGRRFGHNGSNQGFESFSTADLDGGDGLVLMANGQNSWQLFEAIARTLARVYGWADLAAPTVLKNQRQAGLPALAGQYGPQRLRAHGGRLWLQRGAGAWQPLWAVAGGPGSFATEAGDRLRVDAAGLWLGNAATPLPRQPLAAQALPTVYLRGSFNGWGTSLPLAAAGPGRWQAEVDLPAGSHEFKLGDAQWQDLNLGAAALTPGRWTALQAAGPNTPLTVPAPGRWRVELRLSDDSPRPAQLRLSPR